MATGLAFKRIHSRNLAEVIRKHVHVAKQSIDKEWPMDVPDGSASFCWWDPMARLYFTNCRQHQPQSRTGALYLEHGRLCIVE